MSDHRSRPRRLRLLRPRRARPRSRVERPVDARQHQPPWREPCEFVGGGRGGPARLVHSSGAPSGTASRRRPALQRRGRLLLSRRWPHSGSPARDDVGEFGRGADDDPREPTCGTENSPSTNRHPWRSPGRCGAGTPAPLQQVGVARIRDEGALHQDRGHVGPSAHVEVGCAAPRSRRHVARHDLATDGHREPAPQVVLPGGIRLRPV